jgi:hypothetical protein
VEFALNFQFIGLKLKRQSDSALFCSVFLRIECFSDETVIGNQIGFLINFQSLWQPSDSNQCVGVSDTSLIWTGKM